MGIKPGYRQTEAGVIPEGWQVSSLRNCCSKITDGTHDTPKPVRSGIPFLMAIHIKDNWIDYESCLHLKQSDHAVIFRRCNPEKNDVLMVNIGAGVATTALVNVEYEFSLKNVALLKPDRQRAVGAYLNYSLAWRKPRVIQDLSSGGAQPFLSLSQIGEIQIPLPPTKVEQEAIAEALSDADALIESLGQLIAKKRNLKQGAMQELLTGERRLPGFNGKWELKRLGSVAEIVMGQSPSSAHYNNTGDGLPLIQGNADIFNRKTIARVFTTEIGKRGRTGDILISVRAPVGEVSCAIFDVCLGRGVCAIRYPNDFLYHALIAKEPTWTKVSKGSTFDSVNSTDVKAFEIEMPADENEQTAIATILSDMDAEIAALEAKLTKARQIKQGMMQELLTGRIRLV